MHAHSHVFAQYGEILSEVKLIAQLADCGVALAKTLHGGRRKKPLSQSVFSHARTRGRKELEHAALSKQVEVVSVYMMGIVESLARFSQPKPTIFNASQASFVKSYGTLRQFTRPQNARVVIGDAHESRSRRG